VQTTSQRYFSSALDFIEQCGITPLVVLQAIDFEEFSRYRKQQRVAAHYYCALLDYGKEALNDPLFGLRLGNDIHHYDYGVLGYLVESSENLAVAIQHLLAFDQLVANIGQTEFRIEQQRATLRWTPQVQCSEQVVLRNMATWLATTKQLLGEHMPEDDQAPNHISFCHPFTTAQREEMIQQLGCQILVNQPFNEIVFPSELLSLTFRSENPQLHQTMVAISQQELSELHANHCLKDQIIALLQRKPDLQDCSLIQFANVFHMSPRTLQRQLKKTDCHFATLLDDERKQRTLKYIGQMRLGDLSLLLGFNEQSSFNRAFKRWFNCSPRVYLSSN